MSNEIHSLLAKYFNGESTAEENERVQQWIASSDENRAEFELLQKLWNRSAEQEEIAFDTTKAWQSVNAKINVARTPAKTVRMFSRRTAIASAAAIVLLLGLWWLMGRSNTIDVYADVDVREVHLKDGSTVYLRKGSSLSYYRDYGEKGREVVLNGEAFFDVARDTTKPFRVVAGNADVQVLGTSFNVDENDDTVVLVVKTGLVKFGWSGDSKKSILVAAGERALFNAGALSKSRNTDENFNAWQSKKLVFNNTPLPQVAATLSDYYQVKIMLRNQDAAQLSAASLTAQFNNQSLSSVLEEISLITSYRVQRVSEGNYEISIK
jgi:ferric-dicitrate binding protein FerR (iron transport regulator)